MRNNILLAAIKSRKARSFDSDRLNRLLSGANLRNANLRGADLHGANVRGVRLRGADLLGANLSDANLSAANLSLARLKCADVRWADLSDANLSDADLSWTQLKSSNLRGADLRGADLRGADLSWSTFSDADLRGVNLSDANLMGARGIKCAACHWPDHGECGRQLLGVIINGEICLFCGCFTGDKEELVRFIANGKEQHKKSRTLAMEFVCARLEEMNTLKGGRDAQI